MAKQSVAAPKMPKEKPKVRVPAGSKLELKEFDSAVVGEEATMTVRGKVIEIRSVDKAAEDDWDAGKTIEIELSACKIAGPNPKIKTMDDAIEANRQRV
jgi:hypothetical protein